MRRLFAIGFLIAAFVADGSAALVPAARAAAVAGPSAVPDTARPAEDRSRGLVYEGLRRSAPSSLCGGSFELAGITDRAGRPLCTHGPDPGPPGVDVRARRDPPVRGAGAEPAAAAAAQSGGSILCDGDGSSGPRVQVIYARSSSVADRYDQFADSFQQWVVAADAVFNNSAAKTYGIRHVRFVTDGSCRAAVDRVVLSPSGDDNVYNTVSELYSHGYSRSDRKYLVFMDAYVYCGIGFLRLDDRPTSDNQNNGAPDIPSLVGRVDAGCWGQSAPVEAHELMHTLGGVQPTAPNATPGFHCTDESDRMCYSDGTGSAMRSVCTESAAERLFDCRNDDYFHTSLRGTRSWLANHWNTANSRFLTSAGPAASASAPTTTVPPPTTTIPPGVGVPSAPQYLRAAAPPSGSGVSLSWVPPSSSPAGPVTGYRIYRGTTTTNLTLLASLATPPPYVDRATVSGTLYYYQVSAVNSAGEGPRSYLAGRTAI